MILARSWEIKPPLGVQLNRGHPLAVGLTGAWLLNDFGYRTHDLVTGIAGGITGGVWEAGPCLRHDATSDYVQLYPNSGPYLPTGAASAVIGYEKTDTTARVSGAFGVQTGTTAERFGAHIPYSNGQVHFDYGGFVEDTNRESIGGLTFGGNDAWVFSTGQAGMQIWRNGNLLTSNSATPTRTAGTSAFQLGGSGTVSNSDLARYHYLYVYARQLTRAEVAALYVDPYAFLVHPRWIRGRAGAAPAGLAHRVIGRARRVVGEHGVVVGR